MTRTAKFFRTIKKNIGHICMVFGILAATIVLFSWTFGYWSNGLYGTHFQIDSCWQGISASGVGLVGLFKWLVDSTKNSPKGQYPVQNQTPTVICYPSQGKKEDNKC